MGPLDLMNPPAVAKPPRKTHRPADVPTQWALIDAARKLRAVAAQRLAHEDLVDAVLNRWGLTASNLIPGTAGLDIPVDDPDLAWAFNTAVTLLAVESVLDAEESGVSAYLFQVGALLEVGAQEIHLPLEPTSSPLRSLAVAKENGYFFTPPAIAFQIAEDAIGGRHHAGRVLDPAAGSGNLLIALILTAAARNVSIDEVVAIERDPVTAAVLDRLLRRVVAESHFDIGVTVLNADTVDWYLSRHHDDSVTTADTIVMNPPYGRAKFLKNFLSNAETATSEHHRSIGDQETHWREQVSTLKVRYSEVCALTGISAGRPTHHRVFIAMANSLLSAGGRMAFIAPSNWLADKDDLPLRKQTVAKRRLASVRLYTEASRLFPTVNQPTAVIALTAEEVESVSVYTSHGNRADVVIPYAQLEKMDAHWHRVPTMDASAIALYIELADHTRIGSITTIKNARGELDLTNHKHAVSTTPTGMRLVRGDHIERFEFRKPEDSKKAGFVTPGFVQAISGSSKTADIARPRIVGRQCSYQGKNRRLSFAAIPGSHVVANSCNYLIAQDEADYWPLLGLTNCSILEWTFRLYNANNHVANYEIDELPVPDRSSDWWNLLGLVAQAIQRFGSSVWAEATVDAIAARAFDLRADQLELILSSVSTDRVHSTLRLFHLFEDAQSARRYVDSVVEMGWVPNHAIPRLSDLDMEMIRHVPEGGNWTSIPETVPSKRLDQIREMTRTRGMVRTTYYGRLRRDQPSYTISTYFNRPGNGTHIHPIADRTLTSREAARLQSFPDDYVFRGAQGAVRNQIGNAVPPLLAAAIGTEVVRTVGHIPRFLDLFCGAGGLSLGLEVAGWNGVAAADYDADAVATYNLNRAGHHSDHLARVLDLADPASRSSLVSDVLAAGGVDAIVGGPPCQGFSHAGWRSPTDERNALPSAFLSMVESLTPNLVIIENVDGLLTHNGGKTVSDLVSTLQGLGYSSSSWPWLLMAEQYGVPQMRRRVFIVGTRGVPEIAPPPARFAVCPGRRKRAQASLLDESLLPPVTVGDALCGLSPLQEQAVTTTSGEMFSRWVTGRDHSIIATNSV